MSTQGYHYSIVHYKKGGLVLLRPNSILNNEYQIVNVIGAGGMGIVYLAYHLRTGGTWAIKEVDKSRFKGNHDKLKEIMDEAALLGKISYPAIPRVATIIDDPKAQYLYILQDYIDGKTLAEAITDRAEVKAREGITDQYKQRQLSQSNVVNIAKQLVKTFIYLHTRQPAVIYRDLKPGNIMIDASNNIHLIDFGIAFQMTPENLQPGVKAGMGTMGYAAPEQYGEAPYHTLQTDIFNFGRVLYELVTGYCPAPKHKDKKGKAINKELPPIRELRPDIDEALEEIIYTCMETDLKERYKSFHEVKYAFDHYKELGPSFKARAIKRIKTVVGLSLATLVLLSSGIGLIAYDKAKANVAYNDMLAQVDVYNDTASVAALIAENPTVVKPYQRLIDLYKADDVFTLEEEQEFLRLITSNLSTLVKSEGFGDLAYNVGVLYIYYYQATDDVKQNAQLQMAQSVNWFDYALENGTTHKDLAKIYYNLGLFNRDIVLAVKQGEDAGLYKRYFSDLDTLVNTIDLEDTPDLMKLRLVETIASAGIDYRQSFLDDGVSEEAFNKLLEQTYNLLEVVEPKTDITKAKKADLLNEFEEKLGGS